MLESPAYRMLNTSEHRCLSRLEVELAHHGGNENGKLLCTYDNFEKYGVHRHSIAPALRALVALGFIRVTQEGRAGNAEWRRSAQFLLTYKHTDKNSEHDRTDDWRRIKAMAEAKAIASAARKADPEKQNPSGEKRTMGQCGKRTANRQIHSNEIATTCVGYKIATTSIFRAGEAAKGRVGQGQPARLATADGRRFSVVSGGVVIRHGVRTLRGVVTAEIEAE